MKKRFIVYGLQFTVFCISFLFSLTGNWKLKTGNCFAQITFLNTGIDITVSSNCTTFVDGHVIDSLGKIHNSGNIFLTGDWSNFEPSGCLDPAAGTVILSGGNQFIKGNQTTTFNNLDCAGSGTKTLIINTIVGGNTGVLSLNGNPFDLNSNTLIVTNPSSSAITRSSGYIISETPPANGYGTIQWNLGNAAGNYEFPFGTFSAEYIPFHFNISSAGNAANGNISVATYPTAAGNNPNNRPLPTGVANLDDPQKGKDVSEKCADRFWLIDANNYSSNPTADMIFTYRDLEWDGSNGSTNNILEDSLRAWRWDGTKWLPPSGTDNPSANTVTITGINTFSPWTLYSREFPCPLYVPNAFSPNGDSENDSWKPISACLKKVHFEIYNRWGERVFETDDVKKSWDGTFHGETEGTAVFTYIMTYELYSGDAGSRKGNISLMH
ncbi:MAG: gliding motility-associated C-terminal domain-containing protein [Bacteroidetes bacterium]|nr:gliding motility-associated C-terminal domain-containing protein [Bacteroidota bacterium]